MNLSELESLIEDYNTNICVDATQIKSVVSRIGNINWAEFLTLQAVNIYFPEKLTATKFLNFSDVADPDSSVNRLILKDCLLVTQQFSNGTFSHFKSNDVSWGFCSFLLAYLEDVKSNLSDDSILKIRSLHEDLHEQLIQSIKDYDENTMDAVAFLTELNPELTKQLMEELL